LILFEIRPYKGGLDDELANLNIAGFESYDGAITQAMKTLPLEFLNGS